MNNGIQGTLDLNFIDHKNVLCMDINMISLLGLIHDFSLQYILLIV